MLSLLLTFSVLMILVVALAIKGEATRTLLEATSRLKAAIKLEGECQALLNEAQAIKDAVILERHALQDSWRRVDEILRQQKVIADTNVDKFLRDQ